MQSISEIVAIEQSKDENLSNNVDTIIRFFRKTQKGKGKLKVCINLYLTNNSVMVNGSDVTLFNRNHQIIVNSIMNTANVKSLDSEILYMIMAHLKNMNLSKSKLSSKSTKLKAYLTMILTWNGTTTWLVIEMVKVIVNRFRR